MAVKCTNCGGAHPSWDCSKPMKSTAARKDVPQVSGGPPFARGRQDVEKAKAPVDIGSSPTHPAGTQALPVDTPPKPKIGRPRTGFNKKEYNRQFTADLRTIKRLGLNCTVAQYRESLK